MITYLNKKYPIFNARYLYFIPFLFLLLLSVMFFISLNKKQSQQQIIGRKLPNLELKELFSNETMNLNQISSKNYFLIHVFASWCKTCEFNKKILIDLKDKIDIYGVAWYDLEENIRKYLQKNNHHPYKKLFIDKNSLLEKKLGVKSVPETFIVNKEGYIIYHIKGFIQKTDIIPFVKISRY